MAMTSLIGENTVVRGNVRGEGALEILGRIEGDVTVDGDVSVGETGMVKGSVSGSQVTIAGVVEGDLAGSELVAIESGARVIGDMLAPRVGIANGAVVRGRVQTGEDDVEPPAQRRAAVQSSRAGAWQTKDAVAARAPAAAIAKDKKEPSIVRASAASKRVEPVGTKKRPPAPVVPALSRGTRARKKKVRKR